MKRKSVDSGKKFLSGLIILFVIVVFIGFLFVSTNEFQSGITTFYVQCEDDIIMSDREDYSFQLDKTYRFDIKYPLNIVSSQAQGYFVSVSPNTSQNTMFDFSVDGALYGYSYETTLSKGFEIKTYDNYFTFKAAKDLSEILQSVYDGKVITGEIPSAIDSKYCYFKLNITSADKQKSIKITFRLVSYE